MNSKEFAKKLKELENDIVAKAKSAKIPGWLWDDITQEFRIALWKKRKLYDPRRGSFRTFANRVMQSTLIDLYRKVPKIRVPASWLTSEEYEAAIAKLKSTKQTKDGRKIGVPRKRKALKG